MHFNPVKVSLVAFAISFKTHSAYYVPLFTLPCRHARMGNGSRGKRKLAFDGSVEVTLSTFLFITMEKGKLAIVADNHVLSHDYGMTLLI